MIWKDQTHPVEWHFYRHLRAHRCGLSTTDETQGGALVATVSDRREAT